MSKNSRTFWAKVDLVNDFVKHFYHMTPEQRAEDIAKSIDAIIMREEDESFGGIMLAKANNAFRDRSEIMVANGKKGGRPKKSTSSSGKSASIPTTSDNSSIGGSGEIQKALTVAENSQQGFRNGEPLSAFGPMNNVYLTAGEVAEFTKRFGDAQYMIERLSTYMASTNKRYLNHFAKIWEWAMQDVANNINPANGKKLDQYTRIILGAAADGVDLKNPPKPEPKKKTKPRPYEGPIGFEEFG